jgi:argininosuccinate lyase
MPQKKNPDALERARLAAAGAMGPLVAILTSLNAIEYQHSGARVGLEPRAIDALIATTHAMTGVVRTLQPQKAHMLQYATENFATMTDVADMLVRETGIDFRAAHEIVAHVVNAALEAGKKAHDIDVAMVRAAAAAQLGRPVDISAGAVRDALDPVANVARRTLIGGPAASAVQAMIETARHEIAHEEGTLAARLKRLEDAKAHLAGIIAQMIA